MKILLYEINMLSILYSSSIYLNLSKSLMVEISLRISQGDLKCWIQFLSTKPLTPSPFANFNPWIQENFALSLFKV